MEPEAGRGRTRRELIARALVASAATGLEMAAAAQAAAQPPLDDGSLLAAALSAEDVAVLAYRAMLAQGLFDPAGQRLLGLLLDHNRQHADLLRRELQTLGRALPAEPQGPSDVDKALSAHGMSSTVAGAKTLMDAVYVLLDAEALCQGAYYTAVEHLTDTTAMARAAQALACDAQHSVLLRELIYPKVAQAVPDWYVAGVA